MPFDPDKYLAAAPAQGLLKDDVRDAAAERGFDPDAYLADEERFPSQGFDHPLPKSGYAGIPDEDLAWYQKGEKWLGEHGGVKPGQELFTPKAVENKKAAAPVVAGAGLLGAAAVSPAGPVVIPAAAKLAERFGPLAYLIHHFRK